MGLSVGVGVGVEPRARVRVRVEVGVRRAAAGTSAGVAGRSTTSSSSAALCEASEGKLRERMSCEKEPWPDLSLEMRPSLDLSASRGKLRSTLRDLQS